MVYKITLHGTRPKIIFVTAYNPDEAKAIAKSMESKRYTATVEAV